jgi:ABC-type transport system substrate-binding protein
MFQIMQQDLASVGIEAEIDAREPIAFFELLSGVNEETSGKPALFVVGMSGVDPNYLYFLWNRPGFFNMGINGELDALLDEQRRSSGESRAGKIETVQRYLLEHSFMVPLLSPGWAWLIAYDTRVRGFKMGFMASLLFNDVEIAK